VANPELNERFLRSHAISQAQQVTRVFYAPNRYLASSMERYDLAFARRTFPQNESIDRNLIAGSQNRRETVVRIEQVGTNWRFSTSSPLATTAMQTITNRRARHLGCPLAAESPRTEYQAT
jgi:hypothetical protein